MPRIGLAPDATRDRAIEIALELVRTRGPDKLRLTDVARAMDVSHTALYACFANKAALLDAVVDHWLSDTERALAEVVNTGGRPRDTLLTWFETLHLRKIERANAGPELYAAVNTATVRATPAAADHVSALQSQLVTLTRRAELPDPPAAAMLLFEATMAYHHPALIALSPDAQRPEALRRLLDVLLKGLTA